MDNYLTYDKWPVVHFDSCGLEARMDPNEPEEYGVNRIRVNGKKLPMLLLPRGSLQDVSAELSLEAGNELILRNIHGSPEQFREYDEFTKNGFNVNVLNAFLKGTYIHLARRGKIMI